MSENDSLPDNTSLTLSRSPGQVLVLGQGDVVITVTRVHGSKVDLKVTGPRDMEINRLEIYREKFPTAPEIVSPQVRQVRSPYRRRIKAG